MGLQEEGHSWRTGAMYRRYGYGWGCNSSICTNAWISMALFVALIPCFLECFCGLYYFHSVPGLGLSTLCWHIFKNNRVALA